MFSSNVEIQVTHTAQLLRGQQAISSLVTRFCVVQAGVTFTIIVCSEKSNSRRELQISFHVKV